MAAENKTGFSLIEITVTISIFTLLTAMSMLSFNDIKGNISLKNDANELANTLSYAQNKSINSFEGLKHGVIIKPDKYILFSGDSYLSSINKTEYPFRSGVKLYSAPDMEIIFDRLTGATTDTNIIIGTSEANQIIIEVKSSGKISSK